MRIDKLDGKLLGTLDNLNTVASTDIMSNFGSITTVLHHEHLQLLQVVNDNLAVSVRHQETSLGVRAVADLGHRSLSGETATDTVIDTLGLSPAFL